MVMFFLHLTVVSSTATRLRLLGWLGLFLGLFLSLPWLIGCYSPPPSADQVGSFRVTWEGNAATGDPKKPLPVATVKSPLALSLKVVALAQDGQEDRSFQGHVCIFSDRGVLVSSQSPRAIKNGVSEAISVRLFLAFGRTTLWVTAVTENTLCPNAADPEDNKTPAIGRVGSAPSLYFQPLSIRDVQESTDTPYDSLLFKKYAVIGRGTMVVTGVTSNGFYVTDLDTFKDGKGYDSIFVFTFSAPTLAFEEGIEPRTLRIGDLVSHIEGGIDEFSGHTQLTFPSFTPLWVSTQGGAVKQVAPQDMPAPISFAIGDTWSRGSMEKYESALVEIKNAIALPILEKQDGWTQFRQWPVLLISPDAGKNQTESSCEDWIRTELHLHSDANRNGGNYRPCLDKCEAERIARACNPEDKVCIEAATNQWFSCFFSCRFNQQKTGLLDRARDKGCTYAMLMVISNATIPGYDPLDPKNSNRRFPYIRGILQQVRASSFYQIVPKQYESEMSNNGYVIWVRQPDDLAISSP